MSLEKELEERSKGKCELCGAATSLATYQVPPREDNDIANSIYACTTCISQIDETEEVDTNHWRCLNDSMWSEHAPVKVVAWRMLHRLKDQGWPQDLLDMMYLEEEELTWAKSTLADTSEKSIVHKDVNGVVIEAGDSVVLIKDLPVKGSSFVAKRGTAVRRVSLDHENAEYIEGKINGQQIVIVTKYVKKL